MREHPRINLEAPVLRDVAILVLEHEQEIAKHGTLLRGTNGGSDGMIADVRDMKRVLAEFVEDKKERKLERRAMLNKIIGIVVGGVILNYIVSAFMVPR